RIRLNSQTRCFRQQIVDCFVIDSDVPLFGGYGGHRPQPLSTRTISIREGGKCTCVVRSTLWCQTDPLTFCIQSQCSDVRCTVQRDCDVSALQSDMLDDDQCLWQIDGADRQFVMVVSNDCHSSVVFYRARCDHSGCGL